MNQSNSISPIRESRLEHTMTTPIKQQVRQLIVQALRAPKSRQQRELMLNVLKENKDVAKAVGQAERQSIVLKAPSEESEELNPLELKIVLMHTHLCMEKEASWRGALVRKALNRPPKTSLTRVYIYNKETPLFSSARTPTVAPSRC